MSLKILTHSSYQQALFYELIILEDEVNPFIHPPDFQDIQLFNMDMCLTRNILGYHKHGGGAAWADKMDWTIHKHYQKSFDGMVNSKVN